MMVPASCEKLNKTNSLAPFFVPGYNFGQKSPACKLQDHKVACFDSPSISVKLGTDACIRKAISCCAMVVLISLSPISSKCLRFIFPVISSIILRMSAVTSRVCGKGLGRHYFERQLLGALLVAVHCPKGDCKGLDIESSATPICWGQDNKVW